MKYTELEIHLTDKGPELTVQVDSSGHIWEIKIYSEIVDDYIPMGEGTLRKYKSLSEKVDSDIEEWLKYKSDGWREDEESA